MFWLSCSLVLQFSLVSLISAPLADGELLSAHSTQPGDRFGTAVAAAGDVNRDGVPDVLVGAHRAEPNGPLSGRVVLLSGKTSRVLREWNGANAFNALGWSVATLGDLNHDGVADFGFGAPAGTPPEGSVRVVSGRSGKTLFTVVGQEPGDRFGHVISALGDVNADGVSDFAVGAPHANTSGQLGGRVSVHSGVDGSTLRVHEGASFEFFGQSIAGVGDINSDGVSDLLVGVPFSDEQAFNGGSARLFSGLDGSLLMAFHGEHVGDQLGNWVALAGDIDADGIPDLALGVPGDDTGGIDAGAVSVRSGATGALLFSFSGDQPEQRWGVVAGVGDVNGDGRDDLAIGAATGGEAPASANAGRVRILSGSTGETLLDVSGATPNAWFGFALAGVGDLNDDGLAEVIVGAPGHDDVLSVIGSVQALSVRSPGG